MECTIGSKVWSAVLEVAPGKNCPLIEQGHFAFSNVVAMAVDENTFKDSIEKFCSRRRLEVLSIHELMPLTERKVHPESEFAQLAVKLGDVELDVVHGLFYQWKESVQ